MMSDTTTTKDSIVIERTFAAPVDLVWKMWTQPELFKQWYGPDNFRVPVVEMDVRVGGKHLFCMESADGSMKMWTTGEYLEVVPNERLVYTDSFSDENGNLISPAEAYGMSDDQPTTTEVTVQLEDIGGQTKMVMTHANVDTEQEGAVAGWTQSLNKLEAHIESMLNK